MRLILFVIFLNTAFARPKPVSEDAVIVTYESESDESGGYRFSYLTSDSQLRQEQGVIKDPGTDNEALSVTGSYSYFGTDGKFNRVFYMADENGFQAKRTNDVPQLVNTFIVPDSKFTSILSRINAERRKFGNVNESI